MKDVLHVIDSLGPGGAERNLLSIVRRLPRDRFRHHLAWLDDDDRLAESFRPHVETLLPLPSGGRLGVFEAAAALTEWLGAHRVDVVHAQLVRAHLAGRLAARAVGVELVTTWQNTIYDEFSLGDFGGSPGVRALMLELDRATCGHERRFIAVSEHVARYWCELMNVPRARVSVIYNTVEPEQFRAATPQEIAAARAELGVAAGDEVLLSVGRLVKTKGHPEAIAAMPAILAERPRARLFVAGGGPYEPELRAQIASLHLDGKVRLLGVRRDLPRLFGLASAFVFPTHTEGLSLALVEGLAAGLPAAVSDIAPNREVAGALPSVRFFPVGEVRQIAAAAVELLAGGAPLREQARAAAAGVRARFDADALAAQVAEVLGA